MMGTTSGIRIMIFDVNLPMSIYEGQIGAAPVRCGSGGTICGNVRSDMLGYRGTLE